MSWFERAFGDRYLQLYAHRDEEEAARALEHLFPPHALAGRTVLDLACGPGRYLRELYVRGAHAVGIDLSWPLLRRAQEEFRPLNSRPLLARADMRRLPFRDRAFDLTLCMFTSFGYFESVRAHAALAVEMGRVTRSLVLLDVPNPDVLERKLVPFSQRAVEHLQVEERRWMERAPRRVCKSIELRDGPGGAVVERYEERVLLFGRDELADLFSLAGFGVESVYGDYRAGAFDPRSSERMILRLRREVGSVDPR